MWKMILINIFDLKIVNSSAIIFLIFTFYGSECLRAQTFDPIVNLTESFAEDYSDHSRMAVVGSKVYVVWDTGLRSENHEVVFTRSTNGGKTFEEIQNLSNDANQLREPEILASGDNVHVLWGGGTFYRRSTDAGESFEPTVNLSEGIGAGLFARAAVDGPIFAVCWTALVITDPLTFNFDIFYRRSANGGASFEPAINISNNVGDSGNCGIAINGSDVFIIWVDNTPGNPEIFYRRSTDGGVNFEPVKNLSNNLGNSSILLDFTEFPQLSINNDNVYVVWIDDTPGNFDVFYRRSTDGGANFEPFENLSSNPGNSQHPKLASGSDDIHVIWQDRTPANIGIFYRRSIDNGANFDPTKTLSNPSLPSSFTGSEKVIQVSGSNVYAVWNEGNIVIRRSADRGSTFDPIQQLNQELEFSEFSSEPEIATDNSNVFVAWRHRNQVMDRNEILFRRSSNLLRARAILVEFPDKHHDPEHTKDFYEAEIIPNVVDYHDENSYGQVIIQEPFEFVLPTVGDWVEIDKSTNDYEADSDKCGEEDFEKILQFYEDVIEKVESDANITFDDLVSDGDILILVHAGGSKQSKSGPLCTVHFPVFPSVDKTVFVIILSEFDKIGDWAHEIGHRLGARDLYRPFNIGPWDLMANGNRNGDGNNPPFMSSYTKGSLGWLECNTIPLGFGTHFINSLDTSRFGDNIERYAVSGKDFYILEARTNNPLYSTWDQSVPSDALVLYKIRLKQDGEACGKENLETINIPGYEWYECINEVQKNTCPGCRVQSDICADRLKGNYDGILQPEINEAYKDMDNLVEFAVNDAAAGAEKYQIELEIREVKPNSFSDVFYGLILEPTTLLLDLLSDIFFPFISPEPPIFLPDLDLHVYTDDGKHIGVNYLTGEYEVEIPEAIVSGELYNDVEWILLPSDIHGAHFLVSSADNQTFLVNFPEVLEFTDGTQGYGVYARLINPDVGIFSSDTTEQVIQAGMQIEHPINIEGDNINVGHGLITIDSIFASVHNYFNLGWIDDMDVRDGLLDKVSSAKNALEKGKNKTAINVLKAFINQVNAQTNKHIRIEAADILIEEANSLISSL